MSRAMPALGSRGSSTMCTANFAVAAESRIAQTFAARAFIRSRRQLLAAATRPKKRFADDDFAQNPRDKRRPKLIRRHVVGQPNKQNGSNNENPRASSRAPPRPGRWRSARPPARGRRARPVAEEDPVAASRRWPTRCSACPTVLQTRLVGRRVAGVEHRELRDRLRIFYDGRGGVGRREGVGERRALLAVAVAGRNLVGPSSGPMSCRATKHVASTKSSVHFVSLWQGCGGDPGAETTAEHSRSTASGPQSSAKAAPTGPVAELLDDRRDQGVSWIHEHVPPRLWRIRYRVVAGPEDVAHER